MAFGMSCLYLSMAFLQANTMPTKPWETFDVPCEEMYHRGSTADCHILKETTV